MRGATRDIQGPAERQGLSFFFADAGGVTFQTWTKPLGCVGVQIICIAGGGGGGSPPNGAAGTTRTGGGAGGSACVTRVLYPAVFLPDNLFVSVGAGGAGAAQGSASAGSDGTFSAVAIQQTTNSADQVAYSNPGKGGSSSITGGAAGAACTVADCILATFGQFHSAVNTAGSAGGNGAAGAGANWSFGITTGGLGGGGASAANAVFLGGQLNSGSIFGANPGNSSGIAGAPSGTSSNNRVYGIRWKPMAFLSGFGGGSQGASGVGAYGTDGQFGCGGGGGGAGAGTGGAGGNGGDGLVVIMAF